MADLEKTIAIIFQGDDRLSKTISGISGGLDRLGAKAVTVTQPFADLAENALKLEAALAAMAVGGLAYAFSKSSEFESSIIELKKVIGDEIGLLDEARINAMNLSDQYGQSASEVLLSTADFKQAGFDVKGAMDLTKASMDLVIAGGLEASQASELLISTLKGFKAPAQDAYVITDILNEVSNKYATNVEQLGIGMAALSPIAKIMGFNFAETAGILTPVIEIFRSGDEAAVALRTGLLKLIDDSKPVQDALASIGVSQHNANGSLRSGKDILNDVAKAFQTLDKDQKLYITQQLVGIRQAARMVEVFNGLGKSTEITAVAMHAAGSAAAEVAERLKSAEVAVDRFKVGFGNLAIVVGNQFLEAAKGAIDGGTEIENALQEIVKDGTFSPVFNAIEDFAQQLGADLKAVAAAMPEAFELIDWDPMLESIRGVGGELQGLFEAFFGDIDLTTPEGLSVAIQKIVASGTALTNVVGGILNAWQPFVKALSAGVDKFSESGEEAQRFAGELLGWANVINYVAGKMDLLTGALGSIGVGTSLLAATRIPAMIAGFKGLAPVIGTATSALGLLTKAAVSFGLGWTIGTVLRDNIPIVKEMGDRLGELAYNIINFGDDSIEAKEKQAQYTQQLATQRVEMVRMLEEAGKLPSQKVTEILLEGTPEYESEFNKILDQIKTLPKQKSTKLTVEADAADVRGKWEEIVSIVDGQELVTTIFVKADDPSITGAKKKVDDALPAQKIMELKLQGGIDVQLQEIKSQADVMKTAFEWQAKLDIAKVEAQTRELEAVAENINDMFANTGDVISDMVGAISGAHGYNALVIQKALEAETQNRAELLKLQKDMTAAEIALMNARTASIERGDGVISIKTEGVYPELDLILEKIIQRAQVRANGEGMAFLLGT